MAAEPYSYSIVSSLLKYHGAQVSGSEFKMDNAIVYVYIVLDAHLKLVKKIIYFFPKQSIGKYK